jgi:predicted O-methyltransferase YrrM
MDFLFKLISENPDIRQTLKVGCAAGMSSLAICAAICGREGAFHRIIDPKQNSGWQGAGVANIDRTGFDQYELIEEGSQFVLPRLASQEPGATDLVFIDGWHTFDHTLLDMYYGLLLLKVGGLLVVDDTSWRSVSKAVEYFSRLPALRITGKCRRRRFKDRLLGAVADAISDFRIVRGLVPSAINDWLVRAKFGSMVAITKIGKDERR